MKLAEQIKKLRENIQLKQNEIVAKTGNAISKGATPDEHAETEIKGLQDEIDIMKKNLERLEDIEKSQQAWGDTTTPAAGNTPEQGTKSNQGKTVTVESNLPKGIGYAIAVKAQAVAAISKGAVTASQVLDAWNAPEVVKNAVTQKALIGTTTEATFAASLVDYQTLSNEFIELVRGKTAVDKLAPKMRSVPFNVKIPSQTGAAVVGWVGEKKSAPVTNSTFGSVTLTKSKISGIVMLSDELVRLSTPKADGLILDDLVKGTATFVDSQFFDPTKEESTDSPASILNGVTVINKTGVTGADYEADLLAAIKQVTDAGLTLDGAHWVMSETRAATLSTLRDALGKKYFEGMNINGDKELLTLPVEISAACVNTIVLVLPGQILLADDDVVDFSISSEASINVGTSAEPEWISTYQDGLIAIKGERYIRWKPRGKAAAYIKYA